MRSPRGPDRSLLVLVVVAAIAAGFIGLRGGFRAARDNRVGARASGPAVTAAARAGEQAPLASPPGDAGNSGIMPLDPTTLDGFQESNSDAEERLREMRPELSPPLRASLAFRNSLMSRGFDPDRTLLYWMSPDFKDDVARDEPGVAIDKTRTVENLIAVALGDGLGENEFHDLLSFYSPELRNAAEHRRAAK